MTYISLLEGCFLFFILIDVVGIAKINAVGVVHALERTSRNNLMKKERQHTRRHGETERTEKHNKRSRWKQSNWSISCNWRDEDEQPKEDRERKEQERGRKSGRQREQYSKWKEAERRSLWEKQKKQNQIEDQAIERTSCTCLSSSSRCWVRGWTSSTKKKKRRWFLVIGRTES